MNHNRQKIIEIMHANEATKRIHGNVMDACIRIYDERNLLPDIYERIARNPVPFLLLMLELVEVQKRFQENNKSLIESMRQK